MENVTHKAAYSTENRTLCGRIGGVMQMAKPYDFRGVTCPACLERAAHLQAVGVRVLVGLREADEQQRNDAAVEQAQEDAYQDNEARRIGLI